MGMNIIIIGLFILQWAVIYLLFKKFNKRIKNPFFSLWFWLIVVIVPPLILWLGITVIFVEAVKPLFHQ